MEGWILDLKPVTSLHIHTLYLMSQQAWLTLVLEMGKNFSVGLCAPTTSFAHCCAVFSILESLGFHCAQRVFEYKRADCSMAGRVICNGRHCS